MISEFPLVIYPCQLFLLWTHPLKQLSLNPHSPRSSLFSLREGSPAASLPLPPKLRIAGHILHSPKNQRGVRHKTCAVCRLEGQNIINMMNDCLSTRGMLLVYFILLKTFGNDAYVWCLWMDACVEVTT